MEQKILTKIWNLDTQWISVLSLLSFKSKSKLIPANYEWQFYKIHDNELRGIDKSLVLCHNEISVLVKEELFIYWHENNYRSSTILAWELILFPHHHWLSGMYCKNDPVYSATQLASEDFFHEDYFMLFMD